MTIERYKQLDRGHSRLTAQEIHEGWHFCQYLDGALTRPESFCNCAPDNPVHMARKIQARSVQVAAWASLPPAPGSVRWFPKRDDRPPRGWWAGGEYMNTCRKCGQEFIGDKRAGHCADCAYSPNAEPSDNRENNL